MVIFTGEQPGLQSSQSVPNNFYDSGTQVSVNAPRNIGFVKVSKDLSEVLSEGLSETGEFYTFGGGRVEQSNSGIHFVTDNATFEETYAHVKTFKLSSSILLEYEVWDATGVGDNGMDGAFWTYRYQRSEMMELDFNGTVLRGPWSVPHAMQFGISHNGIVRNGKAVIYSGNAEGLLRYEFCTGDNCGSTSITSTCGELAATYEANNCCGNPNNQYPNITGGTCLDAKKVFRANTCCPSQGGSPTRVIQIPTA